MASRLNFFSLVLAMLVLCSCADEQFDPLQAVEKGDYQEALLHWYNDRENPESQNYIGVMHYMGLGMEQRDPGKAKEWFEQAARTGYAPAQYNLGMLYRNGDGIERDLSKSFLWIYAAYSQKHPNADLYIKSLAGQVGANTLNKIKKEAEPYIPPEHLQ